VSTLCKVCQTDLICLGGRSAHPFNWFCPNEECPSKKGEAIHSPALSTQVGGDHYKKYKIQPLEFFLANKIPHLEACIIKYVLRHSDKNGKEDLFKAKHAIDILIEDAYPE